MMWKYLKIIIISIFFISIFSCDKNSGIETDGPGELTDGYVLYSFMGNKSTSLIDTAGNILVFNNNAGNNTSEVLEINSSDEVVWQYSDDFYSTKISGAQRLESGNTIICSGDEARFIEVTNSGEKVWDHTPGNPDPTHPGSIFKIRKYIEY